MGKKNEVIPAPPTTLTAAPAYVETKRTGFETVRPEEVLFERLGLQQALSPGVQSGKYKAGDIVRYSSEQVLHSVGGTPLKFIAVMYFMEYVQFGDRSNPQEPVVVQRSVDPRSALAEAARSWEKVQRADGRQVRKVNDVRNFIIALPGRIADPLLISCMRSAAKSGLTMLRLASQRGNAPLFAGQYLLYTEEVSDKQSRKFFVPRFRVDQETPWASEEDYKAAEQLHTTLREAMEQGMLKGAYDHADREEGEVAADTDV